MASPWTFATLKAADAALTGAPLALPAAASALNAQSAASQPADLAWAALRDVLMNNFDWGSLVQACNAPPGTLPGGGTQTAAIQAAAVALRDCCLWGGTCAAATAAVWTKLTAAANQLTPAAVGAISQASVNAIVALRTPSVAAWSPAVTAGDIQTARGQP